jgi:hypothetical protein
MTTNPKPYTSNTPTREASRAWVATLTLAERMEADLLAGRIRDGVKDRSEAIREARGREGASIQFSADDGRETLFTTAAFVQVYEYLTAHGVECKGLHLEDMVRRYHRMNPPK